MYPSFLRQAASEAPVKEKGWRAGILQDHWAGSTADWGCLNWMGFGAKAIQNHL